MRGIALAVLLAWAPAAVAGDDAAAARFERLTDELVPVCMRAAATRCLEAVFSHADTDGDDRLDVGELEAVRRDASHWFRARRAELTTQEQTMIALGLAVVNNTGVERLVAAYDADDDGALDRAELSADVDLDHRPLPALIRDDEAVDWDAIRSRLGTVAGALMPAPR
ncbi:MAG: hypothetical protein ACLFU0_06440 [Alphaproteobacteria bacterium]